MSHIFGWSYPPGCHSVPGDEPDAPCDLCGRFPDDCVCPECPTHGHGDPVCYLPGACGLVRTPEQIAGATARDEQYRLEAAADEKWAKEIEAGEALAATWERLA
jgi:hypothetical protein